MRRIIEISLSSFKIAVEELWQNKLRTFLSLFGITIGIFCIIGVLATVGSLQQSLQSQIRSLGNNSIYIDKWNYTSSPEDRWKYVGRPVPQFTDLQELAGRSRSAQYATFIIRSGSSLSAGGSVINGALLYGVTEGFNKIQTVDMAWGRYLSDAEFAGGGAYAIVGYNIAGKLFGTAEQSLGKQVSVKGRKIAIIGVIKKQDAQLLGIGGWQFDDCIIMAYRMARTVMNEQRSDPLIIVKGKPGLSTKAVQDELRGVMRAVHKLAPGEDNFALNDINDISDNMNKAFVSINLGGWIIGALAFIVGIFGVANIMFVTVKERTTQIGLKKALGAKSSTILTEFLLESAALCIIGGLIGLLLVFIMTQIVTAYFDFPIFLSAGIIATAIFICIAAGIIAGIIPASQAAKLNPVVAIRS